MLKLFCAALAGIGAYVVAIFVGVNWGIAVGSVWVAWAIAAAAFVVAYSQMDGKD